MATTRKELIQQGYEVTPIFYPQAEGIYYDDILPCSIESEEFGKAFVLGSIFDCYLARKEHSILLYVPEKVIPYHLHAKDVVSYIRQLLTYDEEGQKKGLMAIKIVFNLPEDKVMYLPTSKNQEAYKKDFLFLNEDHLIYYVIRELIDLISDNQKSKKLAELASFMEEISLNSHKKISEFTLSDASLGIFLNALWSNPYFENEGSSELGQYFLSQAKRLVAIHHPLALKILGYCYYEGSNGVKVDGDKAEEYLLEAYKLTQDSSIARTLGYIYYYGKAGRLGPNYSLAFTYFAIGHLAGGYYEATYKLADCYIHGYGTPVCYEAAYHLVSGIYKENLDHFLHGNHAKFADVALRLATYFEKGYFVSKDPRKAYVFFLQARFAIKERLKEEFTYIGDNSVARGISASIERIEEELGPIKRTIYRNGYLLDSLEPITFDETHYFEARLEEGGELRLSLTDREEEGRYEMLANDELGYFERAESIELLIESPLLTEQGQLTTRLLYEPIAELTIEGDNAIFTISSKDQEQIVIPQAKVIFIPQQISSLELIRMVKVHFGNPMKTYDYFLEGSALLEQNDEVLVPSGNEEKTAIVMKTYSCYEDQLALPKDKYRIAKPILKA